ncbi:hypothetical protein K0M31_003690, partial [Melipona bicolor]
MPTLHAANSRRGNFTRKFDLHPEKGELDNESLRADAFHRDELIKRGLQRTRKSAVNLGVFFSSWFPRRNANLAETVAARQLARKNDRGMAEGMKWEWEAKEAKWKQVLKGGKWRKTKVTNNRTHRQAIGQSRVTRVARCATWHLGALGIRFKDCSVLKFTTLSESGER